MNGFWQDCRYALRVLGKNRGVSTIMVFTLALAIGATTAIFSVVHGVLLRPLPYSDPHRIVAVSEVNSKGRPSRLADPNFVDFRDQSHSFQSIAKYSASTVSVSGASQPTQTTVTSVTPEFFKVFKVEPLVGREFTETDDKKGAAPVALVSYGYWTQYFGSARDLSQLHLKFGNAVYSVIGVLPSGFRFPNSSEVWIPAGLDGENPSRTSHNYYGVGRLKDGVNIQQAREDISAIARRIYEESSEKTDYLLRDGTVIALQDSITRTVQSPLLILLGAVGFLLLVACANVANLLLAQASVRERELAIRSALGAGRTRLVRQFLTEALLLSLTGGILGVLGAQFGVAGLVALAPSNLPRLDSVSISIPVLLFALLLSAAVAAGLGVFTAVRATGDLRESLAEGGRGQAGSRGSQRVGRAIVAAQMAITLILVIGAGLLGRSLMKVLDVDPGFRVDKVLSMNLSLPWTTDPRKKATQGVFFSNLIGRLKVIPGVRSVGAASALPMSGGLPDGMFLLMTQSEAPKTRADFKEDWFHQKERIGTADFCVATSGYFQTLGIPLIRGRIFDDRDGADATHVAVISQALAQDRWPNEDPIGHTIEFGNMDGDLRLLTIVGIVGDTHDYGLDEPPRPTVYVNLVQRPRSVITVVMLNDADTASVSSAARGILQDLDPELPANFRTFQQVYSESLGSRRFNVVLIGFFGVTALLLATAGVFGVMSYSVNRRTREFGVRLALGATSGDVLRMVIGQGMRTILIGVAIGIAGSLALTKTVASLLFGVTATDPVTFGAVTFLLIAVALVACYIPAHRATKVDPMVALRCE